MKNLYIYFWRWATWKAFDAHPEDQHGVICFITPNAFISGPGGRGMHAYLRDTCDEGWIINVSPQGHRPDGPTRIFPDVAQPLAICIFLRRADADHSQPAVIHYREVHGRQAEQYQQLKNIQLDHVAWQVARTNSSAPFTPAQLDWDAYPLLNDLFPWGSLGVTTNRAWVQSPGRQILEQRWNTLIGEEDPERKAELFKETRDRTLGKKLDGLPGRNPHNVPIRQETTRCPDLLRVGLRSFDRQWLIADRRVIDFPRPDLWEALLPGQVFLNQQSSHPIESGPAVVATALLPDTHHFNGRGGRVLPMLHPDGTGNVPTGLLAALPSRLGLAKVTAQDLAAYVMAVAGHPGFTKRFKEELLTPGVRVPLTGDPVLWEEAVRLGEEVLWASTYGEAFADSGAGRMPGSITYAPGDPRQVRYLAPIGSEVPHEMRYEAATQTLHLGAGSFGPVPEEVWAYDVGGMGILKKWFGYRKARPDSRRSSPLDDIHAEQWPRRPANRAAQSPSTSSKRRATPTTGASLPRSHGAGGPGRWHDLAVPSLFLSGQVRSR